MSYQQLNIFDNYYADLIQNYGRVYLQYKHYEIKVICFL